MKRVRPIELRRSLTLDDIEKINILLRDYRTLKQAAVRLRSESREGVFLDITGTDHLGINGAVRVTIPRESALQIVEKMLIDSVNSLKSLGVQLGS